MAKNSLSDWDATAANNADVGGIPIVGAAAVSGFDNALREIMAQLKAGALNKTGDTMTGNLDAQTVDAVALLVAGVAVRLAGTDIPQSEITDLVTALAAKAAKAQTISTGTGLTGGGDLSADRTIAVVFADQAEAEAGTLNTRLMTPLRVSQAIEALGGGKILQIQHAKFTILRTASAGLWTNVIDVNITPSSVDSKILIFGSVHVGKGAEETFVRLDRDGAEIDNYTGGDIPANRFGAMGVGDSILPWGMSNMSGQFIDEPASVAELNYRFRARVGAGTLYINRSSSTSATDSVAAISSITVMEISA